MTELHTVAHAKLNLTLDVVGGRSDGYHDLCMVMQEIDLGDTVRLTLETGQPWRVISDSGEIPCDSSNLAVKAARLFFDAAEIACGGLTVEICKRTPVCAGMGGGSADGAAVLRLLQDHYGRPLSEKKLYELAERTGADVPFALFGGTALAEEKGQVLTRLPHMPACHIVLCKPPFPVSTPQLFRAIDDETVTDRPDTDAMRAALKKGDLAGVARLLKNVFEPVVSRVHPELCQIRRAMCEHGALGACMTGSGPTMFGLFDTDTAAKAAFHALKHQYAETFLTRPV